MVNHVLLDTRFDIFLTQTVALVSQPQVTSDISDLLAQTADDMFSLNFHVSYNFFSVIKHSTCCKGVWSSR